MPGRFWQPEEGDDTADLHARLRTEIGDTGRVRDYSDEGERTRALSRMEQTLATLGFERVYAGWGVMPNGDILHGAQYVCRDREQLAALSPNAPKRLQVFSAGGKTREEAELSAAYNALQMMRQRGWIDG